MSQVQDAQGFIDTIKERISNPAIFTFICVWSVYNWQTLGWFLMEPLKFSLKLEMYLDSQYLFVFKEPLLWTAGVILISPFLNNLVDFVVRLADRLYKLILQFLGWKELIEVHKYNEAIEQIDIYKKEQFEITSRFDTLYKEKGILEQKIRDSAAKNSHLESEIKSKEADIENLSGQLTEQDEKTKQLVSKHKNEIEEKNSDLINLRYKLETITDEITKKTNQIKVKDKKINKLQNLLNNSLEKSDKRRPIIRGITIKDDYLDYSELSQGTNVIPLEMNKAYSFPLDIDFAQLGSEEFINFIDDTGTTILTRGQNRLEIEMLDKAKEFRVEVVKNDGFFPVVIEKYYFEFIPLNKNETVKFSHKEHEH